MKIEPFGVEEWMNAWETKCAFNLAETCVASLTVEELLSLAGRNGGLSELLPMKLTYGAIEGSARLRDAIASHYSRQNRENVLVTHGAIGANALVYQAMVSAGDTVVSIVPSYQQHSSIPISLGAEVQRLPLQEAQGFLPDLEALEALVTPEVKLIAMTNPNNPTGALMDEDCLGRIVEIARRADAWILCDEVYRGTDQSGEGTTASVADLYERGISTGSMSKAFSLAGLRLGWIVGPPEVLSVAMIHRDYNTISVGMIDDHLAALALESKDKLLARSRRICRDNLAILDAWVADEPRVSFVRPKSGTTALLKIETDMASEPFCVALLKKTGVLFTPGSALDMEGYVRIGYACETEVLKAGLAQVSGFLRRL